MAAHVKGKEDNEMAILYPKQSMGSHRRWLWRIRLRFLTYGLLCGLLIGMIQGSKSENERLSLHVKEAIEVTNEKVNILKEKNRMLIEEIGRLMGMIPHKTVKGGR